MRIRGIFASTVALAALPALAQQPLSVIEWLSESEDEVPHELAIDPISETRLNPLSTIETSELGALRWDAVGLVSSELSGLPKDLWRGSESADIEELFASLVVDSPQAALDLMYTLLLAETDPPKNSASDGRIFLARVDKLVELGALEHAESLLERAGTTEPEAFRRWFDIGLLTGNENRACAAMSSVPALAPTLSARLFCLVREGQWSVAGISLRAARAIGRISTSESEPLNYFLYPELIGDGAIPEIENPTPLAFRMREAIGQPQAVSALPLAFSYRHLSGILGWKAKIEAGERLARFGAIPPGTLFSAYLERPPPASGGIWDRVRNIQALDLALLSENAEEVEFLVPLLFASMKDAGLAVPFARYFGPRILRLGSLGRAREEAFEIALLSDEYESAAKEFTVESPRDMFLQSLATGSPSRQHARSPLEKAIVSAYSDNMIVGENSELIKKDRLGETLLKSLDRFSKVRSADPFDVGEALFALIQSGFRREATRIALQILVTAER